jgi:hypothetical protein
MTCNACKNVGETDRILRAAAGSALLGIAAFSRCSVRWLAIPGAVLLFTAASGFCPAYRLAHTDTLGS